MPFGYQGDVRRRTIMKPTRRGFLRAALVVPAAIGTIVTIKSRMPDPAGPITVPQPPEKFPTRWIECEITAIEMRRIDPDHFSIKFRGDRGGIPHDGSAQVTREWFRQYQPHPGDQIRIQVPGAMPWSAT